MKISEERKELAAMDAPALKERLDAEKRKQWTSRFALGKRQLDDTSSLQKSRKTIARINMFLAQRERETAELTTAGGESNA